MASSAKPAAVRGRETSAAAVVTPVLHGRDPIVTVPHYAASYARGYTTAFEPIAQRWRWRLKISVIVCAHNEARYLPSLSSFRQAPIEAARRNSGYQQWRAPIRYDVQPRPAENRARARGEDEEGNLLARVGPELATLGQRRFGQREDGG
jgi:hypothetical protein